MNNAVRQFGEFGFVPAVSGAYEVAGDALEFVNLFASAPGAGFEIVRSILISSVHAAVAVVID